MLEDAEAALVLGEGLDRAQAVAVDDHDLAGLDVAHETRADDVERAALGGQDPRVLEAADAERPHAQRVAHAVQRLVGQHQQGIGALDPAQRIDDAVDHRRVFRAGDQVVDHLGVGRRLEQAAHAHQFLAQDVGVGEVAVVGEGQAAEVEIGEDRLDVAVGRAAGRGVAVVADRRVALQRGDDRLLAEDVADQSGRAVIVEVAAVVGDDAGGFLAAVLQGMKAEGGVGGGIGSAVDAEQRTLFMKLVELVDGSFRRALGDHHGGVICGTRRPVIKDISLRRFLSAGSRCSLCAGRGRICRHGRILRPGGRRRAGQGGQRVAAGTPLQAGPEARRQVGLDEIGHLLDRREGGAGFDRRRQLLGAEIAVEQEDRAQGDPGADHAKSAAQDGVGRRSGLALIERDSVLVSITSTIRAATKTTSIDAKVASSVLPFSSFSTSGWISFE